MRTTNQVMEFCATCNRQTLHICQEDRCNHILHLLLSVFTVGLWIPIWILIALSSGRGVPSCTVCGTKAKAGPSGSVTALIALSIGCGILLLFNGIHSFVNPSSRYAPSIVTVKATGNPTPYQSDAEDRADNDRVLSGKSEPTVTPYVNRLVLKNGKYIDAQSPAPTPTTAPVSIWTKEESDSYFKKSNAHLDSVSPSPKTTKGKKSSSGTTIVDNKADADAAHIYFGPSNDRSVITSAEMKADYDENPKAYAQGWKDGWKWASKQSDFSAEEDMEKSLYGDIDDEPGETKALGFQAATFLFRDRSEARTAANAKPAVEGSVSELDKTGETPYQWTQRYIEQAMGVGDSSLISPNVTFGPYATIYNGQHCWMCKVTFHVRGDNNQHCAIVYEEPVMGPEHVVGCKIDF
jgi:hypothetical protein